MTTLAPRPRRTAALADLLAELTGGERAVVSGIDWRTYESLLAARDMRRSAVRILYDCGEVELMTTSRMHEVWKTALAGLILCVAEEAGLPLAPCGQMTIRREDLDRGFEPDDCYYIASARQVLPPRELDFAVDPPPDLLLEIEHTRSASSRLDIYAAFRVPEVWLYDGESLTVLHLSAGGEYRPATASLSFPRLRTAEFVRFVLMANEVDLATAVRELRAWLRTQPNPAA